MMLEWITNAISHLGYVGIAALTFLETIFPPIPSEVIMPFAGLAATRGQLSLAGVIVAGTAGSLLGTLPLYYVGRALGEDRLKAWAMRYGRWLTLSSQDIERVGRWFDRHGELTVLIFRLLPGVRSLVSLLAGIRKMHIGRFVLYSTLGVSLWSAWLASLGYILGTQFTQVADYLDLLSWVVVGATAVLYVFRLARDKGE
jgi:membrane protein DedA with SNARE-associated domain